MISFEESGCWSIVTYVGKDQRFKLKGKLQETSEDSITKEWCWRTWEEKQCRHILDQLQRSKDADLPGVNCSSPVLK